MSKKSLKTLLVIPVYNHGSSLHQVTRKAIETGLSVLVVDDGSTDGGTAGLEDLDCQLVHLPENQGKGAAILAGATIASELGFEAILTLDADGQHNPGEAPLLIEEAIQGAWPAIIIGAREMVQETVPGSSHFGRAFSNFWVRIECGAELSDTQSGMRLYPVREILALKLSRSRYDFEIEVLVKAVWAGLDVRSRQVSVHYPPGNERISHFNKLVDNWRLTKLHSSLFLRRLLPLPHRRLAGTEDKSGRPVVVKNPIQTLKKLCLENIAPFWLAAAVWLGIFLGALPLLACHTLIIIYVAHRLHLNIIAAVAASQFCMPPVVPVLCIEVGYFLRHRAFIYDLSWERWLLEVHHRLFDWLLGSLLVGPVLGCIGGLLVYWLAGRMQENAVKQSS